MGQVQVLRCWAAAVEVRSHLYGNGVPKIRRIISECAMQSNRHVGLGMRHGGADGNEIDINKNARRKKDVLEGRVRRQIDKKNIVSAEAVQSQGSRGGVGVGGAGGAGARQKYEANRSNGYTKQWIQRGLAW